MAVTQNPQVYNDGGATIDNVSYMAGGTYAAGDLIRITSSGTVKLANANNAGAVHGIALKDGSTSDTDPASVLLFTPETVIKIQVYDSGKAPEDLTKGVAYTIHPNTGEQGITVTATNGIAIVVGYAGDATPWEDAIGTFNEDPSVDNNSVLARFAAATLDAHAAA